MEPKFIEKKDQARWDKLVASCPSSGFMQSNFWAEFQKSLGVKIYKIGIFEGKKLLGGAIFLKFAFDKKTNFLYVPEGPVVPFKDKMGKKIFKMIIKESFTLLNIIKSQKTTHLQIAPRITRKPFLMRKFRKAPEELEPKDTLVLDITRPEKEILEQMKQKGRYNIKKANKHDLKIIKAKTNKEGQDQFLKLYETTQKRNKFKNLDDNYFKNLIKIGRKHKVLEVFLVKYQDKSIAAAIAIRFGKRFTYLFGGSSNDHRDKCAPYLLQWEMIKYAKSKGCKEYDFWGITLEKSNTWTGITQFKTRFGGKAVSHIGTYDFPYLPRLYKKTIQLKT